MSPFGLPRILRDGGRSIVVTLPLVAVWVTGALLFAPAASTEELILTVATPILLSSLGLRVYTVLRPKGRPTAAHAEKVWGTVLKSRLLAGVVSSIMLIVLGFATLLAIPLYALLGIEWAPLFGLISSVLLVVFGLGLFVITFTGFALFKPKLLLAIFQVLRHRRRRDGGDDWPAMMRVFLG